MGKVWAALLGVGLLSTAPSAADVLEVPASREAYTAWIAEDPARGVEIQALGEFLTAQGVGDVVQLWQLLRTDTSWRRCGAPFDTPPRAQWANIVPALRFVRDRIKPTIGDVQAVSVYRAPARNVCAGGARASAHTGFWALDMIPERPFRPEDLSAVLCPIHAAHGPRARIGLGLYSATRFHIDARGFRTWGPDRTRATSPCLKG
jgi:hypothetical protein